MKKYLLLFAFFLLTTALFSQTLFTYGTQAVSKEEFLKAYNKNNTSVVDKGATLREYLDLYIKFKLKVKAANDLHIDTLPNINSDLQNFRTQIEESYLNDENEVDLLTKEAFNRSQKDIHVIHLFIPVNKQAVSEDTANIYKAARQAYDTLTKNASFQQAAEELKNNAVTATWGDLGFITVFNIPYEFENIIYRLQQGQMSELYRSKNGYHIFKNIEERKAAGKIKVAQILFALPPGADDEQKNAVAKIADSVYRNLLAGADFSETAKAVSNDNNTYMNGGILPEFGTGKYEAAFENSAFALQKNNEITSPFQTSFGYHILKRLDRTPVPQDTSDIEYLSSLKQQVQNDARISYAKERLLKKILKDLGYSKSENINENALWRTTDSFIVSNKRISGESFNERTTLYSINNNKVNIADWLRYAKNYKNNPAVYKGESYKELMDSYISAKAFEIYRKRLEYYNPDFKYQLQEFKDGNMLFEVMERKIWSKASADSAGLVRFFNQNKTKYYWKESADVILVSCANEKIAGAAAEQLKTGKDWHELAADNSPQMQTDSGRYELYQVPVKLNSNLSVGTVTEPLVNPADSTASFVKIIRVYPAHQPRSFEEARGLVINDYQNFLEEKWVAQLKTKYPVKINEAVFHSLLN